MNYSKISKNVLQNIGGFENIISQSYCMTRIRLVLKDMALVKLTQIQKIDGVLLTNNYDNQLHLTISGNIPMIAKEINKQRNNGLDAENDIVNNESPFNLALKQKTTIFSPITGAVFPLDQAQDDVFSSGVLGKGVVIIPRNGDLISPFDAIVEKIFENERSVILKEDNGIEILIQIGNSLEIISKRYFTPKIKSGDKVNKGEVLVKFDLNQMIETKINVETVVIITNTSGFFNVIPTDKSGVNAGDTLIDVYW